MASRRFQSKFAKSVGSLSFKLMLGRNSVLEKNERIFALKVSVGFDSEIEQERNEVMPKGKDSYESLRTQQGPVSKPKPPNIETQTTRTTKHVKV